MEKSKESKPKSMAPAAADGVPDSSSSKPFFYRSFTFHGNLRRTIDPNKSQPSIADPKKPQPHPSTSLWSQTAKRFSDLGLVSAFRRSVRPPPPAASASASASASGQQARRPPGGDDRLVVYFTSLRSIRRTYEDCVSVRSIFRGFMVPVDERDVSMDSAYRRELQAVLGPKPVVLPQVFIRGRHVGGAEEVRQLLESGELRKLLEGFPAMDPVAVCGNCGGVRFVPCTNCRGSRKVFVEEEGQLRRCMDCNENGLMRCPNCLCG
ncbi:glutaredoxin family protein [Cinnamomum micranthum f. kanehirae]|uniref:Glutaredoxin family protein n=1 Tax=Cinnamomum micranthum f. kanehirae TaxID=337451 RepID=A0A3S3MAB2_9MAGN|nr:glutaredoxin family protein [Cinnamomum micranthum f. kanehirae]